MEATYIGADSQLAGLVLSVCFAIQMKICSRLIRGKGYIWPLGPADAKNICGETVRPSS